MLGSPDWWAADTLSPSGACTCAALHAARLRGDAPSVRHAGEVPGRANVKAGTVLYKVLWKDFPPEIATWEGGV